MSHTIFVTKCLVFGGLLTLVGVFYLGVMIFTWDWAAWPVLLLFFIPALLFFGMAYLKEYWF
ncbi:MULTISPECIES: hypothetical protein [Actinomadura]|uniref:Uncharacterized protein n=1 Tax=Actinomadura madurae TaxID=1993 RepID=A0A1I5BVA4_9ACTN|nr:hypothetical protein [Actinomadura madurae]SFN78686.1 hypothetical protein SAMN04489713_10340 [Actinomadura madurae]SPT50920.1 Uncharacterised protein [Actinomadura madurae]